MGWFFGFKLHLICNEKGELLNFMITPGDIDNRKPLEYEAFVEFIHGKLFGDKGYISKNLFQRLSVDGIQLITKLRPLQNLHPLNFHPYTLRRMNIFDQKMPLEVIFE